MSSVKEEISSSSLKSNRLGQRLSRKSVLFRKISTEGRPATSQPHGKDSNAKNQRPHSNEGFTSPVQSPVFDKIVRQTGSFAHNWPMVYEAPIHYKRAYRYTDKSVHFDPKIKNERNQYRKYAAEFLDTLMKQLSIPITQCLELYSKGLQSLHPYEATVANLTMISRAKRGHPELKDILHRLKQLRVLTTKTTKEFMKPCKEATSVTAIKEVLENATQTLQGLYEESNELTKALSDLLEIHKDLRKIPIIDLTLPTIVLVGSPNVGKSSIVRAISSGTPEVNDYPFTTRGVTIGHILYTHPETRQFYRLQVMDTPGLLNRAEIDRNEMERLTFASLAHLPTAVLYVIDHTNQAGEQSNLMAQLEIRQSLQLRFPRRPWIDVISKGDLLPFSAETETCFKQFGLQPSEDLSVVHQNPRQAPWIISVQTGQNIPALQQEVVKLLLQLRQDLLMASTLTPPSSS